MMAERGTGAPGFFCFWLSRAAVNPRPLEAGFPRPRPTTPSPWGLADQDRDGLGRVVADQDELSQ